MIASTDPRHGSSRGYVAGCREECCATPRRRQQKANRFRLHQGLPAYREADEVARIIAPWQRMGLSNAAILEAAGLCNDHALRHRVLASTFDRLAAVVEEDLPPNAFVWADLTRRRIYSLMAAGHLLRDIPINSCGVWRVRDRVRVDTARTIRDYYALNEFKLGPSKQTASRARNAGHRPPMAWDDPGTLAWPDPNMMVMEIRSPKNYKRSDVDPVVVERVLGGDYSPNTTVAEKNEIMRRWKASGRSERSLCEATGWKDGRYGKASEVADAC